MDETEPASGLPAATTQGVQWHRAAMTGFVEVPLAAGQRFRSVEVQRIVSGGAVGLLAATHRPTGELDVHLSPGLSLDEGWFRRDPFLSHMRFGSIGPAEFRRTRYHVGPREVDVDVEFVHRSGRPVRVEMAHRSGRRSSPWFVPAVRQEDPVTLRFVVADYIRLLPRWARCLRVTVDGELLTPRPFLLPNRLTLFHLARFAGGVFGVGLNGAPAESSATATAGADEVRVDNGDHYFTAILRGRATGATAGDFAVDSPVGTVATGRWKEHAASPSFIELKDVTQQWFPGWRHPTRLALHVIRRFRRRNEVWRWSMADRESEGSDGRGGRWSVSRRVG